MIVVSVTKYVYLRKRPSYVRPSPDGALKSYTLQYDYIFKMVLTSRKILTMRKQLLRSSTLKTLSIST